MLSPRSRPARVPRAIFSHWSITGARKLCAAGARAVIGLVLASAFSAIIVYAQELVPGRTGVIAGLFFGFAFGMGGIGAAVLGELADHIGIEAVYGLCAWLPALGLLAWFLPALERPRRASA